MAGETILVVDDTPVNLKLADILLRKEGYLVHTAPSGEEALRVLHNFLPKIMLVDIRLPGIDGLELTRRVKQDPRTHDLTVIALTACASKDAEERALEAGCAGYITKPINTQTLGQQIRAYLHPPESAAAVAPAVEMPPPSLPGGLALNDLELESIRRRFLEEGALQCRQLLLDVAKAADLAHKWIGAGGALGYLDISAHSRIVEDLLAAPKLDAKAIRETLSDLVLAFADPREAKLDALPESVIEAITDRRIAMVGFAAEEAERLCEVLERLSARPRLFEADEPPNSESIRSCHAVLIHVREKTMSAGWLDPRCADVGREALVFVGGRDLIMSLHPLVQARAQEFLIDGWQPEEALMRLAFAVTRQAQHELEARLAALASADQPLVPECPRILVVDDDLTIRTVLQKTLQENNMLCRAACSGDEAMQLIGDFRPNAAVLDLNMPGMNGFEVLAAIREQQLPVRVVVLTARRQEEDTIRGFRLGADDYMVKPFSPVELVLRLNRLLRKQ